MNEDRRVVGISSGFSEDERVRGLGSAAFVLYVSSITRASRFGVVITKDDLPDLAGDLTPAEIETSVGRLVERGLWEETEPRGRTWLLVENGLWTLDPDVEPDVLGGDLWPEDP